MEIVFFFCSHERKGGRERERERERDERSGDLGHLQGFVSLSGGEMSDPSQSQRCYEGGREGGIQSDGKREGERCYCVASLVEQAIKWSFLNPTLMELKVKKRPIIFFHCTTIHLSSNKIHGLLKAIWWGNWARQLLQRFKMLQITSVVESAEELNPTKATFFTSRPIILYNHLNRQGRVIPWKARSTEGEICGREAFVD
ncbi:hypothetical protein CKAN_02428600 [Cinnamomum micranthum f. kanehirae]|uniref:Uncharacterized protein n=1 Tax=Cinnamomum micranthum f. kanehirae TaxID=337451 RepID=A0A3S4PUE3_9MAGN|nr:hypothetical protein CKAN_02428600 [Cinnamomum micranthum f. kanehirae]